MRVLVTGGAGFIGSHVVEELIRRGHQPVVIDDFSSAVLRPQDVPVPCIRGDIRDVDVVGDAVQACDVVVHLAALRSVPYSWRHPVAVADTNISGTLTIMERVGAVGGRPVVLTSSSSVYGTAPGAPVSAERLLSPYAVSKFASELYGVLYAKTFGFALTVIRPFNVYGPRQPGDKFESAVVPLFVAAAGRGDPPSIHGDGSQARAFCHVRDAARAYVAACERPAVAGEPRVCDVGGAETVSVLELAALVYQRAGRSDLRPVFTEARRGDIPASFPDLVTTKRLLDWEPMISLRDGITSLIAANSEAQLRDDNDSGVRVS